VVLPVSILWVEQVRLACFPREKLRCVHRRVATSRCGGIAGLVPAARISERLPIYNSRRSPDTEEEAYECGGAADRPRPPIGRSGHSNASPFSFLRLRAACVSCALYSTDEFDAPSVRKDTKPENIRMRPSQGVPTFRIANIESACLDACVR
jgi:hypothetical protein